MSHRGGRKEPAERKPGRIDCYRGTIVPWAMSILAAAIVIVLVVVLFHG